MRRKHGDEEGRLGFRRKTLESATRSTPLIGSRVGAKSDQRGREMKPRMEEFDDDRSLDEQRWRRTESRRTVTTIATLTTIAEVKSVFNGRPYISIVLDRERVRELHIKDSLDSIKRSILNHPKIKLKPRHISILGDGKLKIFPPMSDRTKIQFQLHSLKYMLPKVIVKGISTIGRAVFNSKFKEDNYDLEVQGTNLLAVMGIPGVDASKTVSNHVMEIKQALGIEAARNSIINEIQHAMQAMRIDIRHMMLLADVMTYKGDVLGITRFGIAKMKESVLMLASFEKTQDHLFDASFNSRIDQIKGVSECIIMGIPVELGTGILRVRQRVDQLPVFEYGPDPILCGVGRS